MSKLTPYHRSLPFSYALGVFPSLSLLDAKPQAARRLLLRSSEEGGEGMEALRARCQALHIRAEVADHALARISRKENCFAALLFDKYVDELCAACSHVVLHHPSDMGNLGTIFRSCLGFGLRDIALIPPAADYFDPKVIRASMGAVFSLRVRVYDTMDAYRGAFPGHAPYPFMLDGSVPLEAAAESPQTPFSLIFGSEASGLPATFASLGTPVRIPHGEAIDSLNLAVAVSLGAYAFTRQRNSAVQ